MLGADRRTVSPSDLFSRYPLRDARSCSLSLRFCRRSQREHSIRMLETESAGRESVSVTTERRSVPPEHQSVDTERQSASTERLPVRYFAAIYSVTAGPVPKCERQCWDCSYALDHVMMNSLSGLWFFRRFRERPRDFGTPLLAVAPHSRTEVRATGGGGHTRCRCEGEHPRACERDTALEGYSTGTAIDVAWQYLSGLGRIPGIPANYSYWPDLGN